MINFELILNLYLAAKIAILDKELASKKAENIAKQEKVEKEEIDRAQAELNTTRHEIKGIEEKLSALRKFELQFDQYMQQLNDSAIGRDQNNYPWVTKSSDPEGYLVSKAD